jgi:hypothetical protein
MKYHILGNAIFFDTALLVSQRACQNHHILAVVGGDWPVRGGHVTTEAGDTYLTTFCTDRILHT